MNRGRRFRALGHVIFLVVLVLLDIRDLWFKWRWLGPDESYQFSSSVTESLLSQHSLTLTNRVNVSYGQRHEHAFMSGWSGFFSQCEVMDGYHGNYFLHARLRCRLDMNNVDEPFYESTNNNIDDPIDIPAKSNTSELTTMYVSGGVRPDSMAWVACQLLFVHRRPPLCHDNIVVDFQRRYAFTELVRPLRDEMAEPISDSERELLALLGVLSMSAPLSGVVCVEGITKSNNITSSSAMIFGCASPNLFLSSFVGRHATAFAKLHQPFAWLTVHDVNILGMHYIVRQNAISQFSVDATTQAVTHISQVNLSSSGILYNLLLIIDLLLVTIHAISALQLTQLYMNQLTASSTTLSFLTTSLYRSTPFLCLSVISQILSWILVLPATVIWSWSDTWISQIHALLTIVRLWVLVLLIVRGGWQLFVRLVTEAKAYSILRWTYVSSLEIIGLTMIVLVSLRGSLQTVRELKYAVDHQRLTDISTFMERKVFSNAYQEILYGYEDDYAIIGITNHHSVLSILYRPLITILFVSWICTIGVVVARYQYNQYLHRSTKSDKPISPSTSTVTSPYARLPAEELLDTAIRATQLVRSHLPLEQAVVSTRSNQRFLRPEQFLEHGVLLEQDKYLRTRYGFIGVVQAKIQVEDHTIVGQNLDSVEQFDKNDSPTKRRRMSAHIPSLR